MIEISVQFFYAGKVMGRLDDSKSMNCMFEAVSHPQRIKILKGLSKTPLGFSELERLIGVESSGALDFHLKKLGSLVTSDLEIVAEGDYSDCVLAEEADVVGEMRMHDILFCTTLKYRK